jgi:hypothetical protein
MVTEAVYNEWVTSLFKIATEGPMAILGHLLKRPGKEVKKPPGQIKMIGGLKVKSNKKKRITFARRLIPNSRGTYRRTTRHRAHRGTIQYVVYLSSVIIILYNAFIQPYYTPRENTRDPLYESALYNIIVPLFGAVCVVPIIAEILIFLINFQVPIMIMQSLANVSNSWAHRRSDVAEEISEVLIHLSKDSKAAKPTEPSQSTATDLRYCPIRRSFDLVRLEKMVAAFRGATPMNKILQVFSPSASASASASPFPTYDQLVESTRDYLLKRSLGLNDANKRRVMLLAMSTMTRRVILLLTKPDRHNRSNVANLFSRVKIATVRKAITAPYYTRCDNCGSTDEDDGVTFSRRCGDCSYDMCDTCYSKLQRHNPYSDTHSNVNKLCPGCGNYL